MQPNLFISYSRQYIGFVDDLTHKLQKQGFNIWLDYLRLIPGRPWANQIQSGLEESELLLLVVSPESISSRSVEIEWRHFLEHKKRVILLIFQAVPLPNELSQLEWVEFRGGYSSALKKLLQLIKSPSIMERSAPQSGFKAPLVVWFAFILSIITAIYSLFGFWTFLTPWVLIPLPIRILKRNFNLSQVQTALWTLPLVLFFSLVLGIELGVLNTDADFDQNNIFSFYNLTLLIIFLQVYLIPLISILTLLILRSPGIQRWGRPEANVPKFANIYHPNIPKPQPVNFYIDHAPEDSLIARDIAQELTKYGHTPAEGVTSANELLVLLSRFKTDTQADPEKQVVYPILVQRTKISAKLSQMQWIDFRKGVRNLEAIAQLLPQPAKMLAALGVRPTTAAQAAMPTIILVLVDYLIIMGLMDVGTFLSYIIELIHLDIGLIFNYEPANVFNLLSLLLVSVVFSGVIIYFMVQSLTERRGFFASPATFSLGMFAVFALFFWQGSLGIDMDTMFSAYGIIPEASFSILPLLLLTIGGILVGIIALFRIKAIRRWFPAKVK